MKKRIVSVFFVTLFLCRAAFAFEANVSRTVIPEGESFQLYLRQDGNGAQPDISVLNDDFLITAQRKSFKSTFINGKAQTFSENVLTLIPQKTGKVVLPSIRAGKEKTSPITLTVVAGGQALPDDPAERRRVQAVQPNVFIRSAINDKTPYVGQQIPLTVRLYSFTRTPLLDGTVVPRKADGITAEQWGEAKRSQEVVNDRAYDVLEYRFLLFAQKSGKIRLSPVQFQGTISDPDAGRDETDDFFNMGGGLFSGLFNQKNISVQSDPILLNVRPAATGTDGYWLPATDVAVSEDLTPSQQSIALGEAVTRTVTVAASGVLNSQIPDPEFAGGSEYKQYPGKTDSKNLFDQNGVIGVKTRQIVFMPTTSGKIVLPSMEIPWFNVKTGKREKAFLPSRTITVTGETTSVSTRPAPHPAVTEKPDIRPEVKEESAFAEAFSDPLQDRAEQQAAQAFWKKTAGQSPIILFSAGLLAGGTAVLILWLLFHFFIFGKKKPQPERERIKMNDSAEIKRLKEACLSGSAEETKRALLDWARIHWPEKSPLTATEVAERMGSPALKAEAGSLNEALYGETHLEWNGKDFWLAFKEAQTDEKKKADELKIPVPPLYPQ